MRVSILGTNGLLSTCIASYCNNKNFELHMYGRTEPKSKAYTSFQKIDLLVQELNYSELAKSDLIIYTAGAGIQSVLKDSDTLIYHLNVTVPVQICNSLRNIGYKKMFMSFGSYSEIGENNDNTSFTEIDVLQSQFVAPNDYTISKRMLTRFFSCFSASFTFFHFILPTIYGENEATHRLIPYTLRSIDNGTDLVFTSGEQIRQYIYIDDAVELLFKCLNADMVSGIYNIPGAEEFSVKELVTLLFKLKKKDLPENMFGKAERSDVGMKVLRLDGRKLQNSVDYVPGTTIAEIYKKYKFD